VPDEIVWNRKVAYHSAVRSPQEYNSHDLFDLDDTCNSI